MSKLRCNVENCINFERNLCVRPLIKIDGDCAEKSCDTFCHSFNHRINSIHNSISGTPRGEEKTDIKCTAHHCSYNSDDHCTAQTVEVTGNGACRCVDTECKTFVKA